MGDNEVLTQYLRLVTYDTACEVADFINNLGGDNYSSITVGGLTMQVVMSKWSEVIDFIESLDVRYEITKDHPEVVTRRIVSDLRKNGII